MNKAFMDAIQDIAEAMQFETWLRFYFIQDENGALFVRVPDEAREKIKTLHPHLSGIVEILADKVMDYNASLAAVCQFVVMAYDGSKYREGTAAEVFDSREFQTEMHLFNLWTQAHEEQLDEGFLDFGKWRELFQEWKNSPEVQEHFRKMREKHLQTVSAGSTATQ